MNFLLSCLSILFLPISDGDPHQQIISSSILSYDLRYWVHVPEGYEDSALPVMYVTDGKWYREGGKLLETSSEMIASGKVAPHIIVLVDAFDPHNPSLNRRNSQFLCNPKYVKFYREELIPEIEKKFNVLAGKENRAVLGLSFGGLNSMYFTAHAGDYFGKVGIQSPAPHPCPDVYEAIDQATVLPEQIFLSTGTINDKARESRRLKAILEKKDLELSYIEVAEGHNWNNWRPLLDDVLHFFYKK